MGVWKLLFKALFFSCDQLPAHHCHLPSSTSIHLSIGICWSPVNMSRLYFWSLTKWNQMLLPFARSCIMLTDSGQRPQDATFLISLPCLRSQSYGLHIALRSITPDCRHSHICFLELQRGSLQRAPSGVCGMCAHIWGESMKRGGEGGLAGVVYFQRVVLRMCWEVEELRGLSALRFGFHLAGIQLRRGEVSLGTDGWAL